MATKLVVNSADQLEEVNEVESSGILRGPAKLVSYLFHPVFVPVYILAFLLYIHPSVFAGLPRDKKLIVLLQGAVAYVFFPVVTVLLLRGLNFIQSIYLKTQRDRIIPLVASGVWYFWIWWVWYNLPGTPPAMIALSFAIFISSSLALMANIIMKVSLHAIAMGVMMTFIVLLAYKQGSSSGLYISAAFFIAGLVCTSRFLASDHTPREIYGGLLLGAAVMLIGNWFFW